MAREGSVTSVGAPTAGAVTLFLLEDGAEVTEYEQLIAIEAMKTLFYVVAPVAGIFYSKCSLGQVVKRDEILCEIHSR